MSIVHCKIPRAGLGNQLFPLLKAYVFADLNELPVCVTGYYQFRIGPYLRNEKIKRNYTNYFKFEKNILSSFWEDYKLKSWSPNRIIKEPELDKIENALNNKILYQFSAFPHWSDFFKGLREHRELVERLVQDLLKKQIKQQIELQKPPCIGVHIRRGDFRALKKGEEFHKVGSTRTDDRYFIDCIQSIRKLHGQCLPASIFTDGYKHELSKILELENVNLVEGNPDIVDMLLLSKSQILITSAGSTFGYWAGFLANAPIIIHYDHLHNPLRPAEINLKFYEGPLILGQPDSLLIKNIKEINNFEYQTNF